MKTKLVLFAALLIASFINPPAQAGRADDAAIRQLAARLETTARTYKLHHGWYLHDFLTSFIGVGEYVQTTVWLDAGDEIVFRGMGDSDLRDLDIVVFGPNGRRVAQDTDFDATPYVSFIVRQSGWYTVRLGVMECRANGSYCGLLMAEK